MTATLRSSGTLIGGWHGPMEELLANFVPEPKKAVNTLKDNRVYAKVGSNSFFEVSPPVVHFGGYTVGQTHRQVVHIINCSGCSRRITVVQPSTPFFSVLLNKKGLLAPGMSEELTIEFRPTEWQYYYDSVKIHAEDENLVIPLHGYPIINQVVFPKRVDLGYCNLGESCTREVRLECKVPIQFEYELKVLNPIDEFTVKPCRGLVPANGHVSILIEFVPIRPMTYSIEVEVRIAQFNFVPFTSTIVGTGVTGESRARLLLHEVEQDLGPGSPSSPTQALEALKNALQPQRSGGGAGHGDAYTRVKTKADRGTARLQGSLGASTSGHVAAGEPTEEEIDGLRLPRDLNSHGAVSYVLQQQRGKLRIKDLKAAIERQRQERARMEAVTKTGKSGHGGLSLLDDDDVSRELKVAVFVAELAETRQRDREKELRFCVAVGEDLMTEEETAAVLRAHSAAAEAREERARTEARQRASVTFNRSGQRATRVLGEDLLRGHVPDWNAYKSDTWHKRAQALERFIHAVQTVIYRLRAQRRLDSLQACIKEAGGTRAAIAALVDGTLSIDGNATLIGSEDSVTAILDASRWVVQDGRFPVRAEESGARARAPAEVPGVADFEVLEPLPLKEPLRCNLMGYRPEVFAPISSHVPLMGDQPLLVGAEDEEILPGANSGDAEQPQNRPEPLSEPLQPPVLPS